MGNFGARETVEKFARQMMGRATAGRSVVHLAVGFFGGIDEAFEVVRGYFLRVDDDHLRHRRHQCYRNEAFFNVVIKLRVHRWRNRVMDGTHEKRVAIRRCLGRDARAECAARTATIVDDELFAGVFAQGCGEWSGEGVSAAACRKRYDDGDRFAGPGGLRLCRKWGACGGGNRCDDQASRE